MGDGHRVMPGEIPHRLVRLNSIGDPRVADFALLAHPAALVQRRLILLEGRLVLRRAIDRGRPRLRALLLTDAAVAALGDTVDRVPADVPVYVVPQAVMNDVAGFNIHRGCLALAARTAPPALDQLDLSGVARALILEGVSNPDNVGGLFRNAAAFGASAVLLDAESCDPLYRKSIRVSSGASLWLPFSHGGTGASLIEAAETAGHEVWALTPRADAEPLPSLKVPPRVALLMGAEGPGLPSDLIARARPVRIPMTDGFDSLNVATAAALTLAHVFNTRHG